MNRKVNISVPIIFCAQQRSGTTVLQKMMAQSKDINTLGEVFHGKRLKNERIYFNFYSKMIKKRPELVIPTRENCEKLYNDYMTYLAGKNAVSHHIIDIKYNSWHHFNPIWQTVVEEPFLFSLVKKNNIKVIHIVRNNLFKQCFSSVYANKINKRHIGLRENAESDKKIKFEINPVNFHKRMKINYEQLHLFRKWLYKYPNFIELYYEKTFVNGQLDQVQLARIEDFLKMKIKIPLTPTIRKSVNDLNEIVLNKKEVLDYFRNTEFKKIVHAAFRS